MGISHVQNNKTCFVAVDVSVMLRFHVISTTRSRSALKPGTNNLSLRGLATSDTGMFIACRWPIRYRSPGVQRVFQALEY